MLCYCPRFAFQMFGIIFNTGQNFTLRDDIFKHLNREELKDFIQTKLLHKNICYKIFLNDKGEFARLANPLEKEKDKLELITFMKELDELAEETKKPQNRKRGRPPKNEKNI